MGFKIDAADVEMFRRYFARRQPDWIVDGERKLLRVVLEEVGTQVIRVTIDLDLHLAMSAPEIERIMLLRIVDVWRAHVRYLIQAPRQEANRCSSPGCLVHATWHCSHCGLLLCSDHEPLTMHTCEVK